jgi:glycosyltransferase involved in cell wall biosynthesis
MRVLYDYQAFGAQRAGGVSRYFVELMQEWESVSGIEAELIAPLSVNTHLKEAYAREVRTLQGIHVPAGWGPSSVLSLMNRAFFSVSTLGQAWDIYHPTYYNCLWPSPRARRKVVTVFDMTHELFPSLFHKTDPTIQRKRTMVESADGVICISDSTRRDLLALTEVSPSKTTIIPLATRILQIPPAPFRFRRPYWLFVGARGGYKDFSVLLEAVATTPELRNETDIVCFGGGSFSPAEQRNLVRFGMRDRVHQVAGQDALLRGAYENAIALVYPSRHEGFGLPPLEAMTVGCPTITVNGSSLPEVVGDGGVQIPVGDIGALIVAMERLLCDSRHRWAVQEAGRTRARRFSWAETALQTQAFYQKVLA